MNINNWIAWLGGGFALLLLGALAVLLVLNANQRAELASAEAAKTLLLSANKEWAQKVTASNAALAKIHAADVANAKAIAKAQAAAGLRAKKLEHEAAIIAGLKFTGSDCDQILHLTKAWFDLRP